MGIYDSAITQIQSSQTIAEIEQVVSSYSAQATGTGGVLYTGKVGDVQASVLANQIASQEGVSILDNTARGQLLVSAQDAIVDTATNIFLGQGLDAAAAENAAQTLLYGGVQGTTYAADNIASSLWGQASNSFASSLSGDITVVGTTAQADAAKTFGAVELPALLNNPNITSVGGVAVSDLETAGSDAFGLVLNQFSDIATSGVYVPSGSTAGQLSQEAFQALGYSGTSVATSQELVAQGLTNLATNAAEIAAVDILGVAGTAAVDLLSSAVGGAIINVLTSATPANAGEDEIARENNLGSDLPDGAAPNTSQVNPDGSLIITVPIGNSTGGGSTNYTLDVNAAQTEVSGAVTVATPGASGGVDTTTSLFDSSIGSAPVGQVTSAPDANGDGGSSLRFATPEEEATLSGTSINPTQVTPTGNGGFTFGTPQADPNGLINQLTVDGAFGTAALQVTDPTTGQTMSVALDNGSSTDLIEGRSVATGMANEQVQSTQSSGQLDDTVFGQGATAVVNNATITLENGASASITGNGNSVTDDESAPLQEGRSVAVDGNNNVVVSQAGDSVTVSGTGDIVDANGASVTLGANSSATINGSGATVMLEANDSVFASGDADEITAQASSGVAIAVSGTADVISANGADITIGSNSFATIEGNNNNIMAGQENGSIINVLGTGDTIASAGNVISISGVDVSDVVNGFGNQIESNGGSGIVTQEEVDATAGVANEVQNYTLVSGGIDLSSETIDYSNGNSQQALYNYGGTVGKATSSETLFYDAGGVETNETVSSEGNNSPAAIVSDNQTFLNSAGISSAMVLNDMDFQADSEDATQLLPDPSGQSSLLVWTVGTSNASTTSPVSVTAVTDVAFATTLASLATGNESASSNSLGFVPGYEQYPSSANFVQSPLLMGGSFSLPTLHETQADLTEQLVAELGRLFGNEVTFEYGNVDDTFSTFVDRPPNIGKETFVAGYNYNASGAAEFAPMFDVYTDNGMVSFQSVSSQVNNYVNNPSNPALTTDDLIEATYANLVEPKVGPNETAEAKASISDDVTFVTDSIAEANAEYSRYIAEQAPAPAPVIVYAPINYQNNFYDAGDDYGYQSISYEDDWEGSEYSVVFSDISGGEEDVGGDDDGDDSGADFPVVLNLGGQQVHTVSAATSNVQFDVSGTGAKVPTGWITSDEGFLVLDPRGGDITSGAQLVPSFSVLQSFDTNHDGVLSANEADVAGIEIWIDENGDGVETSSEVYTLSALGITSVNVTATQTGTYDNGNIIAADSAFTYANGLKGDAADVYLLNGAVTPGETAYTSENSTTTVSPDGSINEILTGSDLAVDMAASGVNTVIDYGSYNTITAGAAQDAVILGGSDSILIAGAAANASLFGGETSEIYGGSGNDLLVARYNFTLIQSGVGTNTIEVDSDINEVNAVVGTSNIEISGNANTINTGTNSKVTIKAGGGGNDINSSDANITIENGSSIELVGNSNIVTEDAAADLSVTGTGNILDVVGANSLESIVGSVVTIASGVTYSTVQGSTDTVDVLGSGVTLGLSGSGNTAVINDGTVLADTGASITVQGNSDSIDEVGSSAVTATGSGNILKVTGANNFATLSSGSSVLVGNGSLESEVTLTGNNLAIAENTDSNLATNGTGETVDIIGLSNFADISNDVVTLEAGASGFISGNKNSITAVGTGVSLIISGTGNTATINDGAVILSAGTSTVNGSGNVIIQNGISTLTALGSDNTLQVTGAGNFATVATGTLVKIGNGSLESAVALTGNNLAILENSLSSVLTSGTGETLDVIGIGNTATVGGGTISLEAGSALTLSGNSDTVALFGASTSLTASGSHLSVDIQGSGDTATVSNSSLTLETGVSATVSGSSDSITTSGTGDTLSVSGFSNTATVASGTVVNVGTSTTAGAVTLTGNGLTVTEQGAGSSVTISGTGISLDAQGANELATVTSGTVSLETNASLTLTGNSDAVTLKGTGARLTMNSTSTGTSVDIRASNDTTTVTSGTETIEAGVTGTILYGNSDTVNVLATGGFLTLYGTGDTVAVGSESVILGSSASATLNGNSDVIAETGSDTLTTSGTGDTLSVSGSGNAATVASGTIVNVGTATTQGVVTLTGNNLIVTEQGASSGVTTSGTGISLDAQGANELATVTSGTVSLETNASLTLTGNSDAVTLKGTGARLTMNSTSTGTSVDIRASNDTTTVTSGTETIEAGVTGTILYGNSDTVNVLATGGFLTLYGTGDTVAVGSESVILGSSASATLNGNSDVIAETGSDTLTTSGTGDTLSVSGSGNAATVASGTIVNVGTATTQGVVTLTGNNLIVTEQGASSGVTTSGTGISLDAQGANELATVTSGTVSLETNASLTLTGNSDAVTLKGTGARLTMNSTSTGTSVDIRASNDTTTVTSGTETIEAGVTGTILYGNSDTVNVLATGGFLTLYGTGDTVAVGSESVILGSSASATLNGNSDVIAETGSDTLTTSGTGDTLSVSGSGNAATVASGTIVNVGTATTQGVVTLTGNNLIVTEQGASSGVTTSGTGISLDAQGANELATVTSGTVSLETNASLTLTGNSDAVTLKGTGARLTMNSTSTGTSVDIRASNDTTTVTSGTETIEAGVTGTILYGNSDTVNVLATGGTLTLGGTGDTVNVTGTNDTLTVASAQVNEGSNITSTVKGNSDTVAFGSSDTITVTGTGETYDFGSGDGQGILASSTGSNTGVVDLISGASEQNLWFQKVGNNLQVDILGTNNNLTIDNWFGGTSGASAQSFAVADGMKLDTQVASLVSAMATYAANNSGFNPVTATQVPADANLQSVVSSSWHK